MFRTSNELCLHIENLKLNHEFDTYTEAVSYFYEYESDEEMERIVKNLNQSILDHIRQEAIESNSLKGVEPIIPIV